MQADPLTKLRWRLDESRTVEPQGAHQAAVFRVRPADAPLTVVLALALQAEDQAVEKLVLLLLALAHPAVQARRLEAVPQERPVVQRAQQVPPQSLDLLLASL